MEVIRNSAFPAAIGLFMAFAISGEGRANAASPEHEEYFEKHVRPILVERCLGCHGPKKQRAGLRLDSASGLRAPP